MVYDAKTKEVCHVLTDEGYEAYQKMLEFEGDKMLVDSEHKILAFFVRLFEKFGCSRSFVQRRYEIYLDEMKQNRI